METVHKRPVTDVGASRLADADDAHAAASKRHKSKKLPKQHRVGNFRSYYEYRLGSSQAGLAAEQDPRLSVLQREWFEAKRGLDVGCNSGAMTIAIAKLFAPQYVLGVDVDPQLVSKARSNLKEYMQKQQVSEAYKAIGCTKKDEPIGGASSRSPSTQKLTDSETDGAAFSTQMPLSFQLWKPPIAASATIPKSLGKTATSTSFPYNVVFKCENVVKDSHAGKDYDFITCFSVTKWIHLFHGDDGIKRFFFHLYGLLAPNGRLLLEPQPWKSYHKRKFTSEVTSENYGKIQLRPTDFPQFLTEIVGFKSCTFLQVCQTTSNGFRRPMYLVEKGPTDDAK